MSTKKSLAIVVICLVPTVVILSLAIFNKDCLEESDAKYIFEQAVKLEIAGNLKDARIKYKLIDANACTNYKLRGDAFNKAVAIQKVMEKINERVNTEYD